MSYCSFEFRSSPNSSFLFLFLWRFIQDSPQLMLGSIKDKGRPHFGDGRCTRIDPLISCKQQNWIDAPSLQRDHSCRVDPIFQPNSSLRVLANLLWVWFTSFKENWLGNRLGATAVKIYRRFHTLDHYSKGVESGIGGKGRLIITMQVGKKAMVQLMGTLTKRPHTLQNLVQQVRTTWAENWCNWANVAKPSCCSSQQQISTSTARSYEFDAGVKQSSAAKVRDGFIFVFCIPSLQPSWCLEVYSIISCIIGIDSLRHTGQEYIFLCFAPLLGPWFVSHGNLMVTSFGCSWMFTVIMNLVNVGTRSSKLRENSRSGASRRFAEWESDSAHSCEGGAHSTTCCCWSACCWSHKLCVA